MMQSEHRGSVLQAVGLGIVFASVAALLNPANYAAIVAVFMLGLGIGFAAYWPADVFDHWRRRAADHAERQFTLQQKRASLFATTGPVPAVGPAYNARQERWRKWFIARIEDAKRAGGPHYKGGMSAYVSFDIWKNVFHRHLFALRLVGPIINGQRTEWADGITADAAIAVVRAAHPLPHPDDADPLPETAQGSERENANENARFAL